MARAFSTPLRLALIAALTLMGLSVGLPKAMAHAALLSSDPAAGSTIKALPAQVDFTFNEDIGKEFAQIKVTDSAGTSLTTGDPQVNGPKVSQTLNADAAPAAGAITVAYRVVSEDGHPISDSFNVTYRPAAGASSDSASATPSDEATASPQASAAPSPEASATAAPEAGTEASTDGNSSSRGQAIGLGVAALVLGLGLGWLLTRRRGATTDRRDDIDRRDEREHQDSGPQEPRAPRGDTHI